MQAARRGTPALTGVSQSFIGLGRAQQTALGAPDLPMALIPHPFGSRTRDEVRALADQCVTDIPKLVAAK